MKVFLGENMCFRGNRMVDKDMAQMNGALVHSVRSSPYHYDTFHSSPRTAVAQPLVCSKNTKDTFATDQNKDGIIEVKAFSTKWEHSEPPPYV